MKRHLLNLLTGLSLLLCMASLFLWDLSHSSYRGFYHVDRTVGGGWTATQRGCDLYRGALRFGRLRRWNRVAVTPQHRQTTWHYRVGEVFDAATAPRGRAGFTFQTVSDPTGARTGIAVQGWVLGVPFWAITLATALLPATRVLQWPRTRRRQNRIARGLCPNCSYDLRATPDKCPECGEKSPAATAT